MGKKIFCSILVFSFVCCSDKEIYFDFHSWGGSGWLRSEPAVFEIEIEDQNSNYDVFVEVRNNDDYPFRNLWLFIDCKLPRGTTYTDTLAIDLADVYGKWYGKGFTLHNLSVLYKAATYFPDSGVYVYSIRQGMRVDPLQGVSNIGMKVRKK